VAADRTPVAVTLGESSCAPHVVDGPRPSFPFRRALRGAPTRGGLSDPRPGEEEISKREWPIPARAGALTRDFGQGGVRKEDGGPEVREAEDIKNKLVCLVGDVAAS
jgi:hypothetical protein